MISKFCDDCFCNNKKTASFILKLCLVKIAVYDSVGSQGFEIEVVFFFFKVQDFLQCLEDMRKDEEIHIN